MEAEHDRPDALEAAYDQINSSATFTYSLQFYGLNSATWFDDLRRTTRLFLPRRLFLLEFLVNDQPATKVSTTPSCPACREISFELYIPVKHKGSLLRQAEFQGRVAAPKK